MKEKYQKIIKKLNNETIEYASYVEDPSDISSRLARHFIILNPPELKEVFKWKGEEIKGLVPYLIKAMESPDKDFAAHIMLYAITKTPVGAFEWYSAKEWKKELKIIEHLHWRIWWEKYKDRITWDEKWKRLKPILFEIWVEKGRKEGRDAGEIMHEEMINFIKEKKLPIRLIENESKNKEPKK